MVSDGDERGIQFHGGGAVPVGPGDLPLRDDEIQVGDRFEVRLDPVGRRDEIAQTDLVHVADEVVGRIRSSAIRPDAQGLPVVGGSGDLSALENRSVLVDGRGRSFVDDGDELPTGVYKRRLERPFDRFWGSHHVIAANFIGLTVDPHHRNFPSAGLLIILLSREQPDVVPGLSRRVEPARDDERVAYIQVVVVRSDQVDASAGGGRILAGRADAARGGGDGIGRGSRGNGVEMVGRGVVDRSALPVHVPDADVVLPGVVVADVLAGHQGRTPVHDELGSALHRRQPDPDERRAVRVPRVDFERKRIVVRVEERDVRAVGGRMQVRVVEPADGVRGHADEDREPFERRFSGIAGDRQHVGVREPEERVVRIDGMLLGEDRLVGEFAGRRNDRELVRRVGRSAGDGRPARERPAVVERGLRSGRFGVRRTVADIDGRRGGVERRRAVRVEPAHRRPATRRVQLPDRVVGRGRRHGLLREVERRRRRAVRVPAEEPVAVARVRRLRGVRVRRRGSRVDVGHVQNGFVGRIRPRDGVVAVGRVLFPDGEEREVAVDRHGQQVHHGARGAVRRPADEPVAMLRIGRLRRVGVRRMGPDVDIGDRRVERCDAVRVEPRDRPPAVGPVLLPDRVVGRIGHDDLLRKIETFRSRMIRVPADEPVAVARVRGLRRVGVRGRIAGEDLRGVDRDGRRSVPVGPGHGLHRRVADREDAGAGEEVVPDEPRAGSGRAVGAVGQCRPVVRHRDVADRERRAGLVGGELHRAVGRRRAVELERAVLDRSDMGQLERRTRADADRKVRRKQAVLRIGAELQRAAVHRDFDRDIRLRAAEDEIAIPALDEAARRRRRRPDLVRFVSEGLGVDVGRMRRVTEDE